MSPRRRTRSRSSRIADSQRDAGWITLEVLAALVVLGAILGPLMTGFDTAVDRARAARQGVGVQGEQLSDSHTNPGSDVGEAWTWGSRVMLAEWRAGPELRVRVARAGSMSPILGVWVDGWFRGDERPGESGETVLKAWDLGATCGQELVLRVRVEDGCWGPPWRSVVPDSYAVPAGMTQAVVLPTAEGDDADQCTILHTPEQANPAIWISDVSSRVMADGVGFPVFVRPGASGGCSLSVGGGVQSWIAEPGKALDVYF